MSRQLKRVYLYFTNGTSMVLPNVTRIERSTRRGMPAISLYWGTGKKGKHERKYTYETVIKVEVSAIGVCPLCRQGLGKCVK